MPAFANVLEMRALTVDLATPPLQFGRETRSTRGGQRLPSASGMHPWPVTDGRYPSKDGKRHRELNHWATSRSDPGCWSIGLSCSVRAGLDNQSSAALRSYAVAVAGHVVSIRTRIAKMSQAVFASFMNVSVSTVQKWESPAADKHPSGAAAKLLQLVESKGVEALIA